MTLLRIIAGTLFVALGITIAQIGLRIGGERLKKGIRKHLSL